MNSPDPIRRWLLPTPGHLLAVLLAVEGILLIANWFRWIPKGWAVLIAVAAVGVFMIGMLVWFILAIVFHRQFQFSIRSLLVLTVAVAIPASWLGMEMKAAREQREAIAAIRNLDGLLYYDYRFDQSGRWIYFNDPLSVRMEPDPPYPAWLRKTLGDDFFASVYCVQYSMPKQQVTDDSLGYVEGLVGLRMLLLQGTSVTDAGLSRLQHLPLEDLQFRGEPINDDGLKNLVGMKELKTLGLSDTKVGNAGMVYVSQLPNLKSLCLSGTNVGDEGLAQLRNARQLVWLDLSETPATDSGMEHLRTLKNLHYLGLAGTKITDQGLLALKGLPKLDFVKINDALPGRGKNYRVNLRKLTTEVTDEGVQEFQKALPKCKIQR